MYFYDSFYSNYLLITIQNNVYFTIKFTIQNKYKHKYKLKYKNRNRHIGKYKYLKNTIQIFLLIIKNKAYFTMQWKIISFP